MKHLKLVTTKHDVTCQWVEVFLVRCNCFLSSLSTNYFYVFLPDKRYGTFIWSNHDKVICESKTATIFSGEEEGMCILSFYIFRFSCYYNIDQEQQWICIFFSCNSDINPFLAIVPIETIKRSIWCVYCWIRTKFDHYF